MKQLTITFLAILLLSACGGNQNNTAIPQWEYKIVTFTGSKLPTVYSPNDKEALILLSDSQSLNFPETTDIPNSLNLYGKEGWELVNVYTTEETVFPQLEKDGNTRTKTINFVFKKQVQTQAQ